MFRRFRLFLGPTRTQALFLLLVGTGLLSLMLNVVSAENDADWITPAQNALVAVFLIGTLIIVGGKIDPFERGRWLGILAPAAGLILIGMLFLPDRLLVFAGGALGWVIAGLFLFRPRGPMAYQAAIKAFRKNNFKEAIDIISDLIKDEPNVVDHYRLRAEFFRVWGKLDRAKKDYDKIAQLTPDESPLKWVGYHGQSEVLLQMKKLDEARSTALKAAELAPDQWVIPYNLGMIEDRAQNPQAALTHLDRTLTLKVPEAHYRFLIHFYRARAYARLGQMDAAEEATKQLKKHGGGLNQWQIILQSDQADSLRAVLEQDIKTAEALFNSEMTVKELAG